MRKAILFLSIACLLNFNLTLSAQICGLYRNLQLPPDTPALNSHPVIMLTRCASTANTEKQPLLLVDGEIRLLSDLGSLSPDDIESIDVLKKDAFPMRCGTGGPNNVILITTKRKAPEFLIRDKEDGRAIPSATVRYISGSDTMMFVSDEDGLVIPKTLKPGKNYRIEISSVGYKDLSIEMAGRSTGRQEILLERDIRSCTPVVVLGYGSIIRSCGGCYCIVRRRAALIGEDSVMYRMQNNRPLRVYPNPVSRGREFYIETGFSSSSSIRVTLISSGGYIISSAMYAINKGSSRINIMADTRWGAGVYFIRMQDERGEMILEKIVIQ